MSPSGERVVYLYSCCRPHNIICHLQTSKECACCHLLGWSGPRITSPCHYKSTTCFIFPSMQGLTRFLKNSVRRCGLIQQIHHGKLVFTLNLFTTRKGMNCHFNMKNNMIHDTVVYMVCSVTKAKLDFCFCSFTTSSAAGATHTNYTFIK